MKKIITAALTIIGLLLLSPAIARADWQQTISGPKSYSEGRTVQQTNDGGYIIVGSTSSYPGAGDADVLLIKTDADGNVASGWPKPLPANGTGKDMAYGLQQTTDGGYIIAGFTTSFGAIGEDVLLIKTNSDGIEEWAQPKRFGGSGNDRGYSVEQTSDGGYIIAGVSAGDVYLVKTHANGQLEWQRAIPMAGNQEAYSVRQTSDGGYIIAGISDPYTGSWDALLIKTDSSGNPAFGWTKTFGGSDNDQAYSAQQTNDGGYILAGPTASYATNGGVVDAWLIKTDANGIVVPGWPSTGIAFGSSYADYAYNIKQTMDGGYIIAGASYGNPNGSAWIIKTNASGAKEWEKFFGGPSDWAYGVQQTSDGGYIMAGTINFSGTSAQVLLAKVASALQQCAESVPLLRQYSPPWGTDLYDNLSPTPTDQSGNPVNSIKRWGCMLTSCAMIINYQADRQGIPFLTTPRDLNDWLKSQINPVGYVGEGYVNPPAVVKYAQDNGIDLYYHGKTSNQDDSILNSYICQGDPIILGVRNDGHFVVATGQTMVGGIDTYAINDPGYIVVDLSGYNYIYSSLRKYSMQSKAPSGLSIYAHSPIELLVTDPNGQKTGFDIETGGILQEIPDSSYIIESLEDDIDPGSGQTTPEVKSFEVLEPAHGEYLLQIIGTGTGPYAIDILAYDSEGEESTQTISGNASAGVTTAYEVGYSPSPGSQVTVSLIDMLPPTTAATLSPIPNVDGWNNTDVVVSLSATDNANGSGIRQIQFSCSGAQNTSLQAVAGNTASMTISIEGITTISYFATDNAGNEELAKTLTVNVDKTPPVISGLPPQGYTLWPPNHKMVEVASAVRAYDPCCGSNVTLELLSARMNEGSTEDTYDPNYDLDPTTGYLGNDIQIVDGRIYVRAERSGRSSEGRRYTITYQAADLAGNTTTSTAICTVPHDQGQ